MCYAACCVPPSAAVPPPASGTPQVTASLAAVRQAKQAAETQMALARIEAEAKARAADEMRKARVWAGGAGAKGRASVLLAARLPLVLLVPKRACVHGLANSLIMRFLAHNSHPAVLMLPPLLPLLHAKNALSPAGLQAQEEAAVTQRNDFMSVMQQLMAERSRAAQLQQQLEDVSATAQQAQQARSTYTRAPPLFPTRTRQGQQRALTQNWHTCLPGCCPATYAPRVSRHPVRTLQASASAQAAMEQLTIEQERSGELADRVQELVAAQEAAAARFRDAQEELELERTRNSSLMVGGASSWFA